MAIFRYEAADAGGKILRGAIEAPNAQEASLLLSERGYRSVRVQNNVPSPGGASAVSSAAAPPSVAALLAGAPKVGPAPPRFEDLALFCRQMASLLHAGFTPSHALGDLGPRTSHRLLSRAASEMGAEVANGASLAARMARHPTLFPPHVVGLVAAGEAGGFLPFAFEEAALNAEHDAALHRDMWLPKFLIWQGVWSVLLFQPLFPSINPEDMGASVRRYVTWLLLVCVPLGLLLHAATFAVGRIRHQPFARDGFDAVSLRVPVMARLAKMRALAAFTRVLRRLLLSGVSPEPAFAGAAASVPNAVLRERLRRGLPALRAGQGMDAAIQATGLMENDPLQLLVTGQKTGQWTEMLDRVTAYYQEEAARATEQARAAQKRAGVLITLITSGYVTIVATHGLMTIGFKWIESPEWQP